MTTIEADRGLTIHEVIYALERIEETYGEGTRVVKIEMDGEKLVVMTTDAVHTLYPADIQEEYR